MAFLQPLDLESIFINYLAGSAELFTFFSYLIITIGSAYFRMPDKIFLIMIAVFSVMMANYTGGIYVLVLFISGIISFYGISRFLKT